MTTLNSKRHKIKFYLLLIASTLFYVILGTALLIKFIRSLSSGDLKPKEYFIPIFVLLVYVLAIYTIYRYFKNAPSIKIDQNHISFNNETFLWIDLQKIELTGKRPFQYIVNFPMEATTLLFNDGRTKYIYDDIYENGWQLKLFLKQVIVEKDQYLAPYTEKVTNSEYNNDLFETFKNNQFTSLRGIALWSLIGIFGYMLATDSKKPTNALLIFAVLFSAFWFLLHSWLMHYFQVSQNFLIVKNHNLFWKAKVYRLSEIKEIVFETQGRMPNCLRVITKDFKNRLYPAGTLREKTWLELKDNLESHNIKVRNECI